MYQAVHIHKAVLDG